MNEFDWFLHCQGRRSYLINGYLVWLCFVIDQVVYSICEDWEAGNSEGYVWLPYALSSIINFVLPFIVAENRHSFRYASIIEIAIINRNNHLHWDPLGDFPPPQARHVCDEESKLLQ